MSAWTPVLVFFSLGLMFVNFFRFNILLVLATIFINIALAKQPNAPLYLQIGVWFIVLAEAATGFVRLTFGRKKRKRFVG